MGAGSWIIGQASITEDIREEIWVGYWPSQLQCIIELCTLNNSGGRKIYTIIRSFVPINWLSRNKTSYITHKAIFASCMLVGMKHTYGGWIPTVQDMFYFNSLGSTDYNSGLSWIPHPAMRLICLYMWFHQFPGTKAIAFIQATANTSASLLWVTLLSALLHTLVYLNLTETLWERSCFIISSFQIRILRHRKIPVIIK